jgi:hypothetical protein
LCKPESHVSPPVSETLNPMLFAKSTDANAGTN